MNQQFDLAAIEERLNRFLNGGQFIADQEQTDEDGTMELTGNITFVDDKPDPEESGFVTAGWFDDHEDAQRFVQMIEDQKALIEEVRALLGQGWITADDEQSRLNLAANHVDAASRLIGNLSSLDNRLGAYRRSLDNIKVRLLAEVKDRI